MHRSHIPSIQGNILAFVLTPLQLALFFSFLCFSPSPFVSFCIAPVFASYIHVPAAYFDFVVTVHICAYFSKPSFSPFIFDSSFSRHRTANHCVLLYLKCLQRVKLVKMKSSGEVHWAGVHVDKIPLPGSTLFTQAICHCQLVVNIQVGSLAICS